MQKFKRGSRVFVVKSNSASRSHFPSEFEGIVEYTYAQQYGGDDFNSYCLVQLYKGKGVNRIAWYEECDLKLLSDNVVDGLAIIEEYRYPSNK